MLLVIIFLSGYFVAGARWNSCGCWWAFLVWPCNWKTIQQLRLFILLNFVRVMALQGCLGLLIEQKCDGTTVSDLIMTQLELITATRSGSRSVAGRESLFDNDLWHGWVDVSPACVHLHMPHLVIKNAWGFSWLITGSCCHSARDNCWFVPSLLVQQRLPLSENDRLADKEMAHIYELFGWNGIMSHLYIS